MTLFELRQQAESASPEERRRMLVDGASFAAMTIQNDTDAAERAFAAWKSEGRPVDGGKAIQRLNYWRQASKRLQSVASLTVDQVDQVWQADTRDAEELFASMTWGFGPAKSCFSLACAGFGSNACLDSHMIRRNRSLAVLVKGFVGQDKASHRMEWGQKDSTKSRFARYWRLQELVFGTCLDCSDYAAAQWCEWLAFMGRTDAHDLLVEVA